MNTPINGMIQIYAWQLFEVGHHMIGIFMSVKIYIYIYFFFFHLLAIRKYRDYTLSKYVNKFTINFIIFRSLFLLVSLY